MTISPRSQPIESPVARIKARLAVFWSPGGKSKPKLPLDILAELVDSLYAPLGSLFVAASCGVFIAALVSFRTGETSLFVCTIVMAFISSCRIALAVAYRAHDVRNTITTASLIYCPFFGFKPPSSDGRRLQPFFCS